MSICGVLGTSQGLARCRGPNGETMGVVMMRAVQGKTDVNHSSIRKHAESQARARWGGEVT